jgi:transcription initiation factor IIF auxiliary subunit
MAEVKIKHTVQNPTKKKPEELARDVDFIPWEIQLDGDPDELKKISKVEYSLPLNYPQAKVTRTSSADNFMYNAYGNNNFDVNVRIYLTGKEKPLEKRYRLTIEEPNEDGVPITLE